MTEPFHPSARPLIEFLEQLGEYTQARSAADRAEREGRHSEALLLSDFADQLGAGLGLAPVADERERAA